MATPPVSNAKNTKSLPDAFVKNNKSQALRMTNLWGEGAGTFHVPAFVLFIKLQVPLSAFFWSSP